MTELRQHSKMAWTIASAYSDVLASETRDLAANIDFALSEERKRCAAVVLKVLREIGAAPGSSIDSTCAQIHREILYPQT